VLGSMVGGVLMSFGWDLATVFAAAALLAFLAAMAMLGKAWLARSVASPAEARRLLGLGPVAAPKAKVA
jgi:MFS transporter, AAHS family, 4-hydroxybenzoate transporter